MVLGDNTSSRRVAIGVMVGCPIGGVVGGVRVAGGLTPARVAHRCARRSARCVGVIRIRIRTELHGVAERDQIGGGECDATNPGRVARRCATRSEGCVGVWMCVLLAGAAHVIRWVQTWQKRAKAAERCKKRYPP